MSIGFIKICGLTTARAVDAAAVAGADALGFVFAPSPRSIEPDAAVDIVRDLPPKVLRVAVMRTPTREEWERVHATFAPDILQMEAAHFDVLGDIGSVRALPVFRDTPELDERAAVGPDAMLFEGARSGTGMTADWSRARRLARNTRLVLAGGLNPDNVADAIQHARPWGVDVSSGVESRRGVKDLARITDFVAAARSAEQSFVE